LSVTGGVLVGGCVAVMAVAVFVIVRMVRVSRRPHVAADISEDTTKPVLGENVRDPE
jgi:hypothetical protein